MLRSESLFGKRETTSTNSPFSSASSNGSTSTPTGGNVTSVNKPAQYPSSVSTPAPAQAAAEESGSKLTVGPNIKVKGEIEDCDTLVVEGKVQATINCRVVQIAERGAFKGSAEIDLAEIRGEFDGELTVRQKLVIYASGKVTGKIRYGKLVIEEGGQLAGDLQVGGGHEQKELLQKTA
ncbi:polymer-forming cytoskeletal protein [Herbaspirillum seropedicae]|uniref:Integral membrane protein n=1 Tax=Herbaspirillum seropedicae (strain SmR1) TaxID=757424 RepID=D8IQ58_HERSS|nr:polymer-forming cytoskeletal protein [Herbaspirillum seropedicae]ADJ63104.1 integral membrane protein [Herbaspirillum seropedicae SmR1]AKN65171.1 cell shape determination protein CcmA [Herbaspirillum seropedicae]AON53928.1 integral membrane protein [Herbaspirillum seropedicae]MDR6398563.1 cytoskeletal protein CcmA (bactofilin family) [Herbaspirillum seropedicae]NQE32147.1 cell shape determination protein CcmA [Herbaspirillum seropedicae]